MRLTLGWTFTISSSLPALLGSLVAVDDPAARQVVRRQLHDDLVLGEDSDVVLTHLPADVCQDLVPVLELAPEHRVGQGLDDPTLDLDGAVLLRHVLRTSLAGRPCSRTPARQDRERSPGDLVVPLPPACGCTPDRARAALPGPHGPTPRGLTGHR